MTTLRAKQEDRSPGLEARRKTVPASGVAFHSKSIWDPGPTSVDTLLAVCATMKPATGASGRSATRSLVEATLLHVGATYKHVQILDLRDTPLPFFQGLLPEQISDPGFRGVYAELEKCGAILFAIPAYWCGVSGVFKNCIDVVCGPLYDFADGRKTVLDGKPAGALIVGADERSANLAAGQAVDILESAGARVVGSPVVVANPRRSPDSLNAAAISLLELEVALLEALAARNAGLEETCRRR